MKYNGRQVVKVNKITPVGGGLLAIGDYSQLEIFIAAILSGEQKLLDALASGDDIHAWVASQIFPELKGMSIKEIKKNHKLARSKSKQVSFGILYQKKPTTAEMETVYELFFNTFTSLKRWVDDTKQFCKENGYVETPFGRFRKLPDAKLTDRRDLSLINAALRRAVNSPIQSTASDCAFIACVTIDSILERLKMKSQFLGGVHDSIIVDAYPGETFEVCEVMKHATTELTHDFMHGFRLNFDMGIGHSWGRQLEIKKEWSEGNRRFYLLEGGDIDFVYLKKELTIGYGNKLKYESVELGDDIEYESRVHDWVPQSKKQISVTISIPEFNIDFSTIEKEIIYEN